MHKTRIIFLLCLLFFNFKVLALDCQLPAVVPEWEQWKEQRYDYHSGAADSMETFEKLEKKGICPVHPRKVLQLSAAIRSITQKFVGILNQPEHNTDQSKLTSYSYSTVKEQKATLAYQTDLQGLYFMDAPLDKMSAQVLEIKRGFQKKGLLIFFSTGLISLFYEASLAKITQESPELSSEVKQELALRQTVEKMVGTLAHEVSHHSFMMGSEDKSLNQLDYFVAAQLREAKVDTIAIDILRKSDYSVYWILDVLNDLASRQRVELGPLSEDRKMQAAGFSTHPLGELRISMARQAATLEVLTHGKKTLPKQVPMSAELQQEVLGLKIVKEKSEKTLSEALQLWQQIIKKWEDNPTSYCAYKASRIAKDWAYYTASEHMSRSEKSEFSELAHRQFANFPPPYSSCTEDFPEEVLYIEKIDENIRKVSFFSSDEYISAITEGVHSQYFTNETRMSDRINDNMVLSGNSIDPIPTAYLADVLPAKGQVRLYERFYPDLLPTIFSFYIKGNSDEERAQFKDELAMYLLDFLAMKVDSLSIEQFMTSLHEVSILSFVYGRSSWVHNSANFAPMPLVLQILTGSYFNSENKPKFNPRSLAKISEFLWRHRSDLAAFEISFALTIGKRKFREPYLFHWPLVLEQLSKPLAEGFLQLRQEGIRAFDQQQLSYDPNEKATLELLKRDWVNKTYPDQGLQKQYFPISYLHGFFANELPEDTSFSPGHAIQITWEDTEFAHWVIQKFTELDKARGRTEPKGISYELRKSGIYNTAFYTLSSLQREAVNGFIRKMDGLPYQDMKTQLGKKFETYFTKHWLEENQRKAFLDSPLFSGESFMDLRKNDRISVYVAEWIDQAQLRDDEKRGLFQSLIQGKSLKCGPFSGSLEEVLPILQKYRVFKDFGEYYDFLFHSRDNNFSRPQDCNTAYGVDYTAFLEGLSDFVDKDLKKYAQIVAKRTAKQSTNFMNELSRFLLPRPADDTRSLMERAKVTLQKDFTSRTPLRTLFPETKAYIVKVLLQGEQSPEEAQRNFELLTATGNSTDADAYFIEKVLPHLKKNPTPDAIRFLVDHQPGFNDAFHGKRVFGHRTAFDVFKADFDERFKQWPKQWKTKTQEAFYYITNAYQTPSLVRDEFFEYAAWKTNATREDLELMYEPKKTKTSSKGAIAMNFASTFAQKLSNMTHSKKRELIEQIARGISPADRKRLENEIGLPEIAKRGETYRGKIMEEIQQTLDSITKASPLEKTIMIELVLGHQSLKFAPLYQNKKEMDILLENILHFKPDTWHCHILEAYTKSIPSHEVPLTYAYMLAFHQEQGGSGVKSLFEVFTTVGVKTGQLAGIWNLFESKAIEKELGELKDHAQPMDKIDVYQTLEQVLPGELYNEIESIPQLLGSASIKTVVQLQFKDGTSKIAMIRRPYAKALVEENLRRAKAFLANLASYKNLEEHTQTLSLFLHIIEQQLEEELEFIKESEKVVIASGHYQSIFQDMQFENWTIHVPLPDREHPVFQGQDKEGQPEVMLMEYAENTTALSALPDEDQRKVGEVLVTLTLATLFAKGFINADPHKGNFLVGGSNIYPIDFGQSEELWCHAGAFVKDDRYLLADFLQALASKNPDTIMARGSKLSTITHLESNQKKDLHRYLTVAKGFTEAILAFQKAGIPFYKRFFGALKGLAILEKENYVPSETFQQIVAKQIMAIKKEKWVPTFLDAIHACPN